MYVQGTPRGAPYTGGSDGPGGDSGVPGGGSGGPGGGSGGPGGGSTASSTTASSTTAASTTASCPFKAPLPLGGVGGGESFFPSTVRSL